MMDEFNNDTLLQHEDSSNFDISHSLNDAIGITRIKSETFIHENSECEQEMLNVCKVLRCYESDEILKTDNSCPPFHIKIEMPDDSPETSSKMKSISCSPSDTPLYSRPRMAYSMSSADTISTPDISLNQHLQLENGGWRFNNYEFEDIFSENKISALRRVTSVDLSSDVQLAKSSLFDQTRRNSFCHHDKFLGKVFCPGDIDIENVIGEGFFGRVYKIIERNTKKVLVMKELKCADYRSHKQFIAEIELVRHLNHPCLVKYIGIIFLNKKINAILEYIEFGTLRKLIKDSKIEIAQKHKIKIALDIASGMAYLHLKKIAHRDITSKNCLVRNVKDFDVVVSDFGLSRVIHRIPSFVPTKQPIKLETVGTAFWMAPEMLMGFDYDHNVDIFSFGIVICELLGRTSAHPNDIPRLNNFGLDEQGFLDKIKNILNPPLLINVAIKCCRINPSNRPSFVAIKHSLQRRYEIDYHDVKLEKYIHRSYLHPIDQTQLFY